MIIEGASCQDENAEAFDTFDCPECNVVTELCEETKRALIVYYQENITNKIEKKKEELKEEQKEYSKSAEKKTRKDSIKEVKTVEKDGK